LELKKELEELQRIEDISMGDILREALGKQLPEAKRAHNTGYNKGYEAAMAEYAVTFYCRKCEQRIPITSADAKQILSSYMTNSKWVHVNCHVIDPLNLSGYR